MTNRTKLAACLLFVAATACTSSPEPEFRIGLLAAMSEDYAATSGEPTQRGAELAAKEINAAGGLEIAGVRHRVRIVVGPHEQRADHAATIARSLLNRDSVHAIIGPQMSAVAVPVARLAEGARVPMISPMSSNPETTLDKRFVFRLAFLDDLQGQVLGTYAAEELGAQTAAILYDEALVYSSGLASRFSSAFAMAGGRIVALEAYTEDVSHTFVDQLGRIAEHDPDVIFLPNVTLADSIQMVEARRMGLRGTFVGSDSWDLQRLRSLPEAQGTLVTHQWHYETPTQDVRDFLGRFDSEYARVPRTTAAMTYDAVRVLVAATAAAGSIAPDAIVDAIRSVDGFAGVTGTISFGGRQDPMRSVVVSKIVDGEVKVLGRVEPRPAT